MNLQFAYFSEFPRKKIPSGTILKGDVLEMMDKIPSKSIQVKVNSPPYFGARHYGIIGQWGRETSQDQYLDRLQENMRQTWRILKDSGIAWINIGDSTFPRTKSWNGIPEEFMIMCKKQGWNIVSKIVWWKRNAMPSSTQIRLSPRYEMIYGFAKTNKWYFDLKSIKVPMLHPIKPSNSFNLRVREAKSGKLKRKYGSDYKATKIEKKLHNKRGVRKQDSVRGADGKIKENYAGFNGRWKQRKMLAVPGQLPHGIHRKRSAGEFDYEIIGDLKNPGDILDITVKPFKEGHFATFPIELPKFLIKCSSKPGDIVLDDFFGSGTTGLAAQELKRKWLGIEINPKYIALAKKRLRNC